ncbi:MAG: hypothetical protein U5N55_02105 [Cypionkella sp.]|nr:hypothetical protein [Cypionkella sp.]
MCASIADSLPDSLRAQVDGYETIYSLNGPMAQIALVVSRELAYSVAREHDLTVMLH